MHNKIRSLLIGAALVAATAASAQAVPLTLFTDQVTKIKYTNYENFLDLTVNDDGSIGNGIIDAGDKFIGVLNATTISNLSSTQFTNFNPSSMELSGIFQISVTGGGIPLGQSGSVTFGMGQGDYMELYTDTTPDFTIEGSVAASMASVTNGNLWMSVLGSSYSGTGDVTQPGIETVNKNWANIAVNNTGYSFTQQLFPFVLGQPSAINLVRDVYFESKVTPLIDDVWTFKSEDPLYVNAVPEPGTMVLLGAGLVGLVIAKRRAKK